MQEAWTWFKICLVFGGIILLIVAKMWIKLARLANYMGYDVNPERGFWIVFVGLVMLGVGLAMLL